MKTLLTTFGLLAASATASAALTFVPQTPVNEYPTDGATEVATKPYVSTSEYQAKDGSDVLVNTVFEETEWVVYPKTDVILLGGFTTDEVSTVAAYAEEAKQLVELDFTVEINNTVANAVWVYPNAIAKLVHTDAPTTVIATLDAEFDMTTANADADAFIYADQYNNAIVINWVLKDASAPSVWDMTVQGVITTTSMQVYFENSQLSSEFLAAVGSDSSIGVNIEGGSSDNRYTLADLYSSITGAGHDKANYGCAFSSTSTECDSITYKFEPVLTEIAVPQFTRVDPTMFTGQNMTQALNSVTEYMIQSRQYMRQGDVSIYAHSLWSQPTLFTTEDYYYFSLRIAALSDGVTVTKGIETSVEFSLSNSGNGPVNNDSKVEIELDFNAETEFGSEYVSLFSASFSGQACTLKLTGNKTQFTCDISNFEADSTDKVKVQLVFPQVGSEQVLARMCTPECGDYIAANITVEGQTVIDDSKTVSETDEGSSGGGSIFWLLLGLPIMVRRK